MLTLRSFTPEDWPVLSEHQYPGMPEAEAKQLIADFNRGNYQGHRCFTLAVCDSNRIVGYVSLLEADDGSASEGVEIYPPYRRRGYARAAVTQVLNLAAQWGCKTVTAQIRKDNVASLALHDQLGFVITHEFVNKRGNPVLELTKKLP